MAKITCSCGSIIPDISDDLAYKGYLLADQDFYDFFDEVERSNGNCEFVTFDSLIEYLYEIYQCESCYKIIVFRDNKRFDFEMIEGVNPKQNILEKYHQKSDINENSKFEIIDSFNYFNDELQQMEHESKGWLGGISVKISGTLFPLSIYTTYRFAQDIEADLESNYVVGFDDYNSNILFVNSITPKNVKKAIEKFVAMKLKI